MPYPPCISVIMLTHNQLSYTQTALKSIMAKTPELLELIVIDNASTDDTPGWLLRQGPRYPKLKVCLNDQNVGFAKGCNQGLQLAQGELLMLINNDVMVTHGWAERMVLAMKTRQVDLVGPVGSNFSGAQAVRGISPMLLADEYSLETYAAKMAKSLRYQGQKTHRLIGTCLLFKRAVLERVGGFDPRFGVGYYEDDDFCYRAMLAGFKLWVAYDVFIHHFGSKSFELWDTAELDAHWTKNQYIFADKWGLTVWPESWLEQPMDEIMAQSWSDELFVPL